MNRIGANRLFEIARLLSPPISYFFEDLADGDAAQGANASAVLTKRVTFELVRAHDKISDLAIRKRLLRTLLELEEKAAPERVFQV